MDLKTYAGGTSALAALLVASTLSPVELPALVKTAAAAPFVLFLPGYALLNATFSGNMSGAKAFTFSIGLSLAIVVLTGFLLDAIYGLTPLAWAVALSGITLFFVWCAPSATVRIVSSESAGLSKIPRTDRAALLAAVVFTVLAIVIARSGASNYKPFDFTELWLVPSAELPATYTVGISNQEASTTHYNLRVSLGGKPVLDMNGIEIEQGDTWITDLPIAVSSSSGNQRLEAWLSLSEQPTAIYRSVWLNTNPNLIPKPQEVSGGGLPHVSTSLQHCESEIATREERPSSDNEDLTQCGL